MPRGKPKKTDGPKKPAKVVKKTFKLHKIQYDFHHCNELYRGFVGGVGCLAPETLIGGVPVGDLTTSLGECETLLGAFPRSSSFVKGRDDLYRVTMESGRQVLVTLGHRFLSPSGWLPLSKLRVGHEIAADGSDYGLCDFEKSTNWTGGCFSDFHHDDEQFRPEEVFLIDKIRQSHGRSDDEEQTHFALHHPSRMGGGVHEDVQFHETLKSCRDEASFCGSPRGQHYRIWQDSSWTNRIYTWKQPRPSGVGVSASFCPDRHGCQAAVRSVISLEAFCPESLLLDFGSYAQAKDQRLLSSTPGLYPCVCQSCCESLLHQYRSCDTPDFSFAPTYTTSFWDKIQDITFVRNGEFYDLTVSGVHHYSANGLYHHNSGKSWIGAYDLLKRAMAPSMAGRYFLVCAPTYTLLKDASQRTTIQLAEELGIIKERFKQPPEIILNNGATVIFRSGDEPDKLRGPNLSGIWLDEASLMSEEVWKVAIGRLREGGEAGFITGTFTPQGTNHWTYQKFATNQPNTAFFKSKTKENPFLSKDFVAALEKNYDERTARQELEGEFLTMDGVEWPNQYFGEHIWIDKFPEAHDLTISAMSLDPSKGKNARHGDYSTTIRLGRDKAGILYVDADLRRCDSETLIAYFIGEVADFYPDVIGIEVNQFQHLLSGEIAKGMKKHNIDIPIIELYNNIQKEVRIRRLGPYLSNKKFRFVRSPGTNLLVSQLREFPLGKYDDGPDGLEMALRVMISTWNGRMGRKAKRVIA